MGFISCSRAGLLHQMLCNRRAEEEGLGGMGVGMRYVDTPDGDSQLVLTWKGKPLPLDGASANGSGDPQVR